MLYYVISIFTHRNERIERIACGEEENVGVVR